jgi:hypothetical protein
VYKDNVLQYIVNEEGRARPVASDSSNNQTKFVYDYFVKDNFGNIPMPERLVNWEDY